MGGGTSMDTFWHNFVLCRLRLRHAAVIREIYIALDYFAIRLILFWAPNLVTSAIRASQRDRISPLVISPQSNWSIIYGLYLGHDDSLNFLRFSGSSEPTHSTIRLPSLPLSALTFVSDNALIGAGHNFVPYLIGPASSSSGA